MSKAIITPTTTRRRLLAGSAAGSIAAAVGLSSTVAEPAPAAITSPNHKDAELIDACGEYLRIRRAFEAVYDALPGDMEGDDPAWSMLDPIRDLTERIVVLRATTAEGHFARARCVAFTYLPKHSACQDDPDGAREDRFQAACLRDLVRLERGAVA